MSQLFKVEYIKLLEQFNEMRRMTKFAQDEVERFKTSIHLKATEKCMEDVQEFQQNRKLEPVQDWEFDNEDRFNVTPELIRETNSLLQKPFEFYGNYL